MRWLKRLVVGLVALVVVLVGLPWAIGSTMDRAHVGQGEAVIAAPPAEVWKTITDFEAMPQWVGDVGTIERLDDADGKPRFRQTRDDMTLTFSFAEVDEPKRLVVNLADNVGYFGGTWTYELSEADGGTHLKITEQGWAEPGLFRFMIWLVGPDATVDDYLAALRTKYGP